MIALNFVSHFAANGKKCIYGGKESGSWSLVDAQEEAYEGDDVVLDERLVQQGVQHAGAEDGTSRERKAEHVGDVRTSLFLLLQAERKQGHAISMRDAAAHSRTQL